MPQFDVTPKEYARRFKIGLSTASRMFIQWHGDGKPFIERCGVETKKYPSGKLLRMSREHYEKISK